MNTEHPSETSGPNPGPTPEQGSSATQSHLEPAQNEYTKHLHVGEYAEPENPNFALRPAGDGAPRESFNLRERLTLQVLEWRRLRDELLGEGVTDTSLAATGALIMAENDILRLLAEDGGRVLCGTPGCPGDARYAPPGRGHAEHCTIFTSLGEPDE